jgi:hypothetical protein
MVSRLRWLELEQTDAEGLRALVPPGEYRVLTQDQLPPFIPSGLVSKTNSAIALSSTTAEGTTILLINLRRFDDRQGEMDQEPFVYFFLPESPALSSGALVHHGDWDGRTVKLPQPVRDAFLTSGSNAKIPLPDDPPHKRGPLAELQSSSHENAFSSVLRKLTE